MHDWMDRSIDGWMDRGSNHYMDECMVRWWDGWIDKCLHKWLYIRLDGKDGWLDNWMSGWIHPLPQLSLRSRGIPMHTSNVNHWISKIPNLADHSARISYLGQFLVLMDTPALAGRENFLHQPLDSKVVHGICIDVSAQLVKISTLCKWQNQVQLAV